MSVIPLLPSPTQMVTLFTDDCDQKKDLIHIHSFAHDFHLRTIQSYFHRPQMGFKAGYHVTSFLAEFVKHYSPRPKYCRNHIHEGKPYCRITLWKNRLSGLDRPSLL